MKKILDLDKLKAETVGERAPSRALTHFSSSVVVFCSAPHVGRDGRPLWYLSRPSSIEIGRLGKK